MVWPNEGRTLQGGPRYVEFYLDEELVLRTDPTGNIPLVEGTHITYIDSEDNEATHRIGDVSIILREERVGSPPSGLDELHIYSTIKVELQI